MGYCRSLAAQAVHDFPGAPVHDLQGNDVAGVAALDPAHIETVVTGQLAALVLPERPAVFRLDPDGRSGVKLSSDPPAEAGTLEGVGSEPLLLLSIALRAGVLLADPHLLRFIPDRNRAVRVLPGIGLLPIHFSYGLVKDVLIHTGILIKQQA